MSKAFTGTFLVAVLFLTSTTMAGAGDADGSATGVAIHLALFVGGLLCFLLCMKIYLLLKGGELSTGWQLFTVSFLIFSCAELLDLSNALEIIALQPNLIRVLQVLALFLILFGASKIKKSLS